LASAVRVIVPTERVQHPRQGPSGRPNRDRRAARPAWNRGRKALRPGVTQAQQRLHLRLIVLSRQAHEGGQDGVCDRPISDPIGLLPQAERRERTRRRRGPGAASPTSPLRRGRCHDRSDDQNPPSVLRWTSRGASPSSPRAYSPAAWQTVACVSPHPSGRASMSYSSASAGAPRGDRRPAQRADRPIVARSTSTGLRITTPPARWGMPEIGGVSSSWVPRQGERR
jgi:hypothetical protein